MTMNRANPVGTGAGRWPVFIAGVLLFLVGPGIYVAQFRLKHLHTPWYVPILATLGVLCMAVSVMQRRGMVRTIGLILFTLLCGLEWFATLKATLSPPYAGPAVAGQKIPNFTTALAGGAEISSQDLAKGKNSVLIFYRGRW
jgi:hypothetical protein